MMENNTTKDDNSKSRSKRKNASASCVNSDINLEGIKLEKTDKNTNKLSKIKLDELYILFNFCKDSQEQISKDISPK